LKEVLYATGAFEIGDQFYDDTGDLRTVTDVLVCHYLRRGTFKVLYEVDQSGEFIELRMRGFGELPQTMKQQTTNHEHKPKLRLTFPKPDELPPKPTGGER
jgi:hypothetical protein